MIVYEFLFLAIDFTLKRNCHGCWLLYLLHTNTINKAVISPSGFLPILNPELPIAQP